MDSEFWLQVSGVVCVLREFRCSGSGFKFAKLAEKNPGSYQCVWLGGYILQKG